MNERSARREAGFTLIELLVVIVVIAALLGAMTLAQSRFVPAWQLASATRQVSTDLRLARGRAVAGNTGVRLVFTSGGRTYRAERLDPATNAWENFSIYGRGTGAIAQGTPAAMELPGGTSTNAAVTVTFWPRGIVAPPGATVTVQHSALDGSGRAISVSLTGAITVSEISL